MIVRLFALSMAVAVSTFAAAQTFPTKEVRLVVGFNAGGSADVVTRVLAEEMSKRFGRAVIVENRVGANALIAAQAVKSAPPDGHMMLSAGVTGFAPLYMKDNSLVASKELAPVAGVVATDYFVYVPADLGVSSLKDLAAWAKANPGRLRFAAASAGNHMLMAMVARHLGIPFENVPYKSTDQTITALLSGEGAITINALGPFIPHLQSGKLRSIAVLGRQRSTFASQAATAAEQGVPVEASANVQLWGPLGTPREVIARVNAVVNDSLKDAGLVEKVHKLGFEIVPMFPEEMLRNYESQMQFLTQAASLIGFKPQ